MYEALREGTEVFMEALEQVRVLLAGIGDVCRGCACVRVNHACSWGCWSGRSGLRRLCWTWAQTETEWLGSSEVHWYWAPIHAPRGAQMSLMAAEGRTESTKEFMIEGVSVCVTDKVRARAWRAYVHEVPRPLQRACGCSARRARPRAAQRTL